MFYIHDFPKKLGFLSMRVFTNTHKLNFNEIAKPGDLIFVSTFCFYKIHIQDRDVSQTDTFKVTKIIILGRKWKIDF